MHLVLVTGNRILSGKVIKEGRKMICTDFSHLADKKR